MSARGVASVVAVLAAVVAVFWISWPTPPGPVVLHTGSAHYVVTATVDSPRMGTTAVDIELADRAGNRSMPASATVEAVMPLMGHAMAPVTAMPVGAGHYRANGIDLMMTGPWELLLSFDSPGGVDHLTLPLTVSG